MAYPTYQYPYQPTSAYYTQPIPDQLAQLRQQQMQPQMMPQPVPQMQPQAPQQEPTGGPIWVQGEAGAKSYLVAPGNTVLLMDSEGSVFYLKSVDSQGIPQPLRVFDYIERGGAPVQKVAPTPQIDLTPYVTREELEEILTKRLQRPGKAPKAKEETDNV